MSTTLPETDVKIKKFSSKYAILMETSGEECESWYYFIRYDKNEENLKHLSEQLESVDWHILGDLSTFDLELEHLVSAQTAKEMTKVDLNHAAGHRKFDGTLKKVNLGFKKKDSNDKKMTRAFDVLGYGQIEDYVSDEDFDEEDYTDAEESEEEEEESGESEEEESEESDSRAESESKKDENEVEKKIAERKQKGIPPALLNSKLPRIAKAKQHRRKKNAEK